MFHEDVSLKYVQDEQVKGAAPLLPFPPSCCEGAGPSAGAGEERPNPTQSQSTTLSTTCHHNLYFNSKCVFILFN
jgi:hypothetical protein